MDVINKAVEAISLHNIPCGIGAHDLRVVQEIEKTKLPISFYIKTLHHHHYSSGPRTGEANQITSEVPGYWCKNPEETIDFMKTVQKPWIAFKVMAAGATRQGRLQLFAHQRRRFRSGRHVRLRYQGRLPDHAEYGRSGPNPFAPVAGVSESAESDPERPITRY